jgi:DNA invertase Pin-like site-specific DNA recombinase
VDCIKNGRVEAGSYLLVENLDRLSREDAGEATELFLSIVNKGVVVVQLLPAVAEFRKPVNMASLVYAIAELSRGHSESAIKSERCRAAWHRKNREAGSRVVTKRLPGWIRYDNGKLALDRAGAAAVRRMFQLARDGYSATAIAKLFNAEKVPVIGRKVVKGRAVGWAAPTIYGILRSRSVLGEYAPYRTTKRADKPAGEVVPDYYPPVVDEETFHAAGAAMDARRRVGRGRRGKHINLFAGLLRDARDGGSISYANRGEQSLLISVNAHHGRGVPQVAFPARVFERAVLDRLAEVRAADVTGDGGDAARRVEALAGQAAEAEAKVRFYRDQCDRSEDGAAVFAGKAVEWEQKRKKLAAELADAQREASSPAAEAVGEVRTLADLDLTDPTTRLKARATLRRAIDTVWCLFVRTRIGRLAAVQVFFSGGRHRSYIFRHKPVHRPRGVLVREAVTETLSFAQAGVPSIDLRKAGDVKRVEALLARLDLSGREA